MRKKGKKEAGERERELLNQAAPREEKHIGHRQLKENEQKEEIFSNFKRKEEFFISSSSRKFFGLLFRGMDEGERRAKTNEKLDGGDGMNYHVSPSLFSSVLKKNFFGKRKPNILGHGYFAAFLFLSPLERVSYPISVPHVSCNV